MGMYVPIAIIVLSNIFYHISSKSTPINIDPFASLTVTYLTGAVASFILYYVFNGGGNIFSEYKNINWSTWMLGISIVGLEVGAIYMYKVGWNISTGQLVYSTILALCLIVVGAVFYHESISLTKIIGVCVCIVGLFLITK